MNGAELLMSLEIGIIYGIVAMGTYLTFRIIDFPDLSCDGSFVLGAAASSILIKLGCHYGVALIVAVLAGSLAGWLTGIINTHFKVAELLSGILVAFMLYSINLKVMGGIPNLALLQENTIFTNTNPLLVLCLLGIVIWCGSSYLLNTDFGLALRSVGQNKRLAEHSGINVKNMTIIGLALSNSLVALGGALFSQHQGFADIGSGIGTVIMGIVAVIIGEKFLPFRSPWIKIGSCIVGSIIYRIIISIALYSEVFGLGTEDLNLLTGIIVIGLMVLPRRVRC